jgi:ketosteroid isomerase-like protein
MLTNLRIRLAVASCIALISFFGTAHASTDGTEQQSSKLLVLEHLWNEAQVNRDSGALEALIADTFIDTEYDGETSDRTKFLSDIRDPKFKPNMLTIQEVKVNLYRDTAVVSGVYHAKGTYNTQAYEHTGRFTDTWIFEGGKWLCVASHSSLIKKN